MVHARRASRSARDVALVAASRAEEPRYAGVLDEEAIELTWRVLRGAGRCGPLLQRWARSRFVRASLDRQERWLLPGLGANLVARKRWVADEVEAAVADGARQLVVLGAGFDVLGVRVRRRHPDVRAIEVDHAPTQAQKARGLDVVPEAERPTLVPLDLARESLGESLEASPEFEVGARSAFVAEGLLMYLAEDDARALFTTFRELCGAGSRFVFTSAEADEEGRARLGRRPGFLRWRARVAKEPLRWAVAPERLGKFLAALGLGLRTAPTPAEVGERYFGDRERHPLLELRLGERFAVAERP